MLEIVHLYNTQSTFCFLIGINTLNMFFLAPCGMKLQSACYLFHLCSRLDSGHRFNHLQFFGQFDKNVSFVPLKHNIRYIQLYPQGCGPHHSGAVVKNFLLFRQPQKHIGLTPNHIRANVWQAWIWTNRITVNMLERAGPKISYVINSRRFLFFRERKTGKINFNWLRTVRV